MISDSIDVVLALSVLEVVPRRVSVIVVLASLFEGLIIGSFVRPAIGLVVGSVASWPDVEVPGTTT